MVIELIVSIFTAFGETLIKLSPYVLAAGVLFPLLSWRFACNPTVPWWRSRDLVTDLCYWFVVPVVSILVIALGSLGFLIFVPGRRWFIAVGILAAGAVGVWMIAMQSSFLPSSLMNERSILILSNGKLRK